MQAPSIRDAARHLVDSLPDDATWEDLMDEIYVRQAIERGLEDSRSGKTRTIAEVRAQFGLKS